jgi:uncharacterized membrane protein
MSRSPASVMDAFRTQLWPLPVLAVVLAVAAGIVLPAVDASVDDTLPPEVAGWLFGGGPEAARSVLQTIAGSLITVTSLTFSLTVVTLQLASSQFSPRLLRTFARDRLVHATLALFLASFAFALTVLRSVRTGTGESGSFVPDISVTVAYALALLSVLGLVAFLAHIAREIRVETIMSRVAAETMDTIDRVFPAEAADRPEPAVRQPSAYLPSGGSGFITGLDKKSLLDAAAEAGAVLRIERGPGSFVVEGVPYALAWRLEQANPAAADGFEQLRRSIDAAVTIGPERTNVQDVGFGFRQLVDVAVRALSPGVNDPTTAEHALGHLSVLLCRLVTRTAGPRVLADADGQPRVALAFPRFEDLLDLTLSQIRLYGVPDPRVAEKILQLLKGVTYSDPDGRSGPAVREQARRLREAIETATYSSAERRRLLQMIEDLESGH